MSKATFIGAGDLMINGSDPDVILRNVKDILRNADVSYVNLEGPMYDGAGEGNPALAAIAIPVRSSPRVARALKAAGVDVVSLANNHTMDYGIAGLEQTIGLLRDAGIAYCGAGSNIENARRPANLVANSIRVSFLSYTSVCPPSYAATRDAHGAAVIRARTSYDANPRIVMQPGSPMDIRSSADPSDLRSMQDDVRNAKANSDVVFVAFHWGVSERYGRVSEYQIELGRAAIDAGASAILGNHAHMLLGIEFYKGCPIFYSLGNFVFDMTHPYFLPETIVVKCDIGRNGLDHFQVLPFKTGEVLEPVPTNERDTQRIAWMLEDLSDGMNTRIVCTGRAIELSPLR